ncbi:18226_t:CDS:2, partial [Racocetra persica]
IFLLELSPFCSICPPTFRKTLTFVLGPNTLSSWPEPNHNLPGLPLLPCPLSPIIPSLLGRQPTHRLDDQKVTPCTGTMSSSQRSPTVLKLQYLSAHDGSQPLGRKKPTTNPFLSFATGT